jgi:hypothetical protein
VIWIVNIQLGIISLLTEIVKCFYLTVHPKTLQLTTLITPCTFIWTFNLVFLILLSQSSVCCPNHCMSLHSQSSVCGPNHCMSLHSQSSVCCPNHCMSLHSPLTITQQYLRFYYVPTISKSHLILDYMHANWPLFRSILDWLIITIPHIRDHNDLEHWRTQRGGLGGSNPPPKLFRSVEKAEPNSQFRGKYILRT